jgi:hypothetical protein
LLWVFFYLNSSNSNFVYYIYRICKSGALRYVCCHHGPNLHIASLCVQANVLHNEVSFKASTWYFDFTYNYQPRQIYKKKYFPGHSTKLLTT